MDINENDENPENADVRYTEVDNDVGYKIEGYEPENPEENNEGQEIETPMGKSNKPKVEKKEIKKFKIILLGEKDVGKSSIIDRYVNNTFSNFGNSGIQDTIKNKKYEVDKDLTADLYISDTTEVEKLGIYPKEYYKDAHGAIIVFNLTDQNSFQKLSFWKNELDSNGPEDIVVCYLGNQSDRTADRKVNLEEIKNFVGDNLYYDVSAKTGNNISLAFEQLTYGIIEKQKEESKNPHKVIRDKEGRKTVGLEDSKPQPKKKKCC